MFWQLCVQECVLLMLTVAGGQWQPLRLLWMLRNLFCWYSEAQWHWNACFQLYKFAFKSAATSTDSGPSTNRPIVCYLCQAQDGKTRYDGKHVFWSYNMAVHLTKEHTGKAVATEFKQMLVVTAEEWERLGLMPGGKDKRKWAVASGAAAKKARKDWHCQNYSYMYVVRH